MEGEFVSESRNGLKLKHFLIEADAFEKKRSEPLETDRANCTSRNYIVHVRSEPTIYKIEHCSKGANHSNGMKACGKKEQADPKISQTVRKGLEHLRTRSKPFARLCFEKSSQLFDRD